MPKYVVLKTLPQGQEPGALVELHEDAGKVFLQVDAVRAATPADEKRTPQQRLIPRQYNRRDLQAVGSAPSSETAED